MQITMEIWDIAYKAIALYYLYLKPDFDENKKI